MTLCHCIDREIESLHDDIVRYARVACGSVEFSDFTSDSPRLRNRRSSLFGEVVLSWASILWLEWCNGTLLSGVQVLALIANVFSTPLIPAGRRGSGFVQLNYDPMASQPASGSNVPFTTYGSTATPVTTPLLTRFTPPAPCHSETSWWQVRPPLSTSSSAGSVITVALSTNEPGCIFPIATNGAPIVYSPGVCPDGYTPASTITSGAQNATTSLCCHEGLTLLPTGDWKGSCGNLVETADQTIYISYNNGDVLISTVVDTFFFVDTPYTVAWAFSELAEFTPPSLPLMIAGETSSRPGTSSPLPTQKSTLTSPARTTSLSHNTSLSHKSSTPSSGLSTGAQAGVGVASGIVGIATGSLFMWFLIRRRSRRRNRSDPKDTTPSDRKYSDELPGQPNLPELGVLERPTEVEAEEKPVEVGADESLESSNDRRHELDGDYRPEELDGIATPIDGSPRTSIDK